MSDDEILVRVEGVSKKFCRSLKRSLWYGVCDMATELNPFASRQRAEGSLPSLASAKEASQPAVSEVEPKSAPTSDLRPLTPEPGLRPGEFWAVNDVSFELRRGECLGLIGRNGAGKTTLLKMLNGLIKPDHGRITMRGRVGALIALGAGFNPILTGRENIYVNASVLGLSKHEIDRKFEEIIAFADIGEFIDSPVQSYSSGMQVRLGFAVATALDPDILLLDEVLAVGDAAFRNRCYNRIGKIRKRSTVVFVSHSMDQIGQFCEKALVLSEGHLAFLGDTADGIEAYEALQKDDGRYDELVFDSLDHPVTAVRIALAPSPVPYGGHLRFRMEVESERPVAKTILKIVFYDQEQRPFAEWNSERLGYSLPLRAGTTKFETNLGPVLFKKGTYRLGVVLNDESRVTMLFWSFKKHEVVVDGFTALGPPVAFGSTLLKC